MLACLAFCDKDAAQALKLAQWITELGGCERHKMHVTAAKGTDPGPVGSELSKAFGSVTIEVLTIDYQTDWGDGKRTDASGVNLMFNATCMYVAYLLKEPFLWIEPDCVSLTPDWLDKIEAEYAACKKRFMGARVAGHPPERMDGVGVYPMEMAAFAPSALTCHKTPWDIAAAAEIMRSFHETALIQRRWGTERFTSTETQPGAVLLHRDKSGVLIDLLRVKHGKEGDAPCPHNAESAAATIATAKSAPDGRNAAPTFKSEGAAIPQTWIGKARVHTAALGAMADSPHHKQLIQAELRKARVIGPAKGRKR